MKKNDITQTCKDVWAETHTDLKRVAENRRLLKHIFEMTWGHYEQIAHNISRW